MKTLRGLLAVIFSAFLATTQIVAQATPTELHWEENVPAALARSKAEKKPILICMHKDKEIACTRMLALYDDPEVRAKMSEFILIGTNISYHTEIKKTVNGAEKTFCPQYKSVPCEVHVANEAHVRQTYLPANTVLVPYHLCMDADGKTLLAKVYEMKKTAYLDWLDRAKLAFGGVTEEGLDTQTKALLGIVRNGQTAEKEKAVKAVLDFQVEAKTLLLYDAVVENQAPADRAVCVRAMGYEQYPHAGAILVKHLKDEALEVVNAAVVSLEETKAGAAKELLAIWAKAKDAELKKDLVRAFGPCAPGDPEVKKILLAQFKANDDRMKQGACMSLGYFLTDADAKKALLDLYHKERDVTLKTAIYYAFYSAGSSDMAADVEKLKEEEKNQQLKTVATLVLDKLAGREPSIPGKQSRQLWKPLFARDRIERNRAKEWGDRKN